MRRDRRRVQERVGEWFLARNRAFAGKRAGRRQRRRMEENRRRCSNVASGAMLTEILEAATDAVAAIAQGDITIAKARLRAILSLVEGPRSGSAG